MIQFDEHIFQMGWSHQLVTSNLCDLPSFNQALFLNITWQESSMVSGCKASATPGWPGAFPDVSRILISLNQTGRDDDVFFLGYDMQIQ